MATAGRGRSCAKHCRRQGMHAGEREKKKKRQTVSSSTIACGATRGAQQRVQLGREEASEQAAHAHAQRGGEPKSGADGAGEQHEEHLVRLLTERAQQHSFAVLKQQSCSAAASPAGSSTTPAQSSSAAAACRRSGGRGGAQHSRHQHGDGAGSAHVSIDNSPRMKKWEMHLPPTQNY